ncbi:hypothetical protein CVS52_10735 [Staphylococcus epidermidis]|nr:hypothetical protein CVS52_10735 [Staphylococcus epidermidis]
MQTTRRLGKKVKELAKKDDIDLEIKHFSDYNVPNKALSDGGY